MGKLTQKGETFQIFRDAGKSMHDAYKLAGFKGNSVSAPYKPEEKIKKHALTDPKLLKTSKKVAKHILEIAEDTLKIAGMILRYRLYASSRQYRLLRDSRIASNLRKT